MKELDFDELDRAVNSLMGDVPTSEPPKDDSVRTVTIDSTDTASSSPAAASTTPPAEPVTPPSSTPAPTPLVAPRKSGRFMDVVHQSSDMKKSPVSPRHGKTIEPGPTAAAAQPQPVVSEPFVTPESPGPAETEPVEPVSAGNEWPDPIDMLGKDVSEKSPEATDGAVDNAPEAEPTDQPDKLDQAAQDNAAEPSPLTTPFLTDAKVEKRPLGGGGAPIDSGVPAIVSDPELADSSKEPEQSSMVDEPSAILPPELDSDIVAIEAGAALDEPSVAPKPEAEPAMSAPEADKTQTSAATPNKPKSKDKTKSVKSAESSSRASNTTVQGSINQQYKKEPSTSDQSSGAIYDTATYHQPLAHPAKKSSSWMWLVWIVLILLLGVAAGAGVYYLGLI